MSRIAHPRFQPGRSKGLAGIEFIDGFAEVDLPGDGILRQALVQHGYGIEDAERPAKASRRSSRAKPAKPVKASESQERTWNEGDSPVLPDAFAVVELADGTIIGDGKSLATLPADERTAAPKD